ncbi:unnamed protein product [Malus baccata var. baccata]
MATRNRTLVYRKYRDALKSVRAPTSSSASSSGAGGGPVIELVSTSLLNPNRNYAPLSTDDPVCTEKGSESGASMDFFNLLLRGVLTVGLPPAWVDLSEEVAANVQRARVKMAELTKAHAKALMPSFGDGKEDQRLIESLTQEITNLIRKSEKRLQRLSAAGPSEDSNVRKNVQSVALLSGALSIIQVIPKSSANTLSMDLRKKQSTYLKRLRQQTEGQDGDDLEMNLNGSTSRMDGDDLDDMMFNERQMAKIKKNEAFTAEREREIQQASEDLFVVVESVNELAQIMKDLSVLVIDQGTIVDRIDYNIQNVASTVDEGLKQLQKKEGRGRGVMIHWGMNAPEPV